MRAKNSVPELEDARLDIAGKVAALRRARHMTQAELSKRLGLSQSRLSEIEKGEGSFSAEQFLIILQLFNVTVGDFAPKNPRKHDAALQNALARHGALHLQESPDVLLDERHEEVEDVVRDVLIGAKSPRHITALAPVLVSNINWLNFSTLYVQFLNAHRERRLAWLVDNVLEAVRQELAIRQARPWTASYRRAEFALSLFLDSLKPDPKVPPSSDSIAPDILDADIRSRKTLDEVTASAADISRRWGIVTNIKPSDFIEALRAARAGT